jgi:hypothetical protein
LRGLLAEKTPAFLFHGVAKVLPASKRVGTKVEEVAVVEYTVKG